MWAIDLAVAGASLFVLPRGRTEHERRMLDEYSAEDCRYLRTLPLPRVLQAVAHDGSTFYFYHENPAPTLVAMRPIFRE